MNEKGQKIWPVTADYVSMAKGQRAEVDKCVPVGTVLWLWDDDGPLNPNDFIGSNVFITEGNYDKYFGDAIRTWYRIGVIA